MKTPISGNNPQHQVAPVQSDERTRHALLHLLEDQQRATAALQQSEQQLRFVTDHAPVLIAQLDSEQRYTFANQPYAEAFGREVANLIGKHVREVIGEELYTTTSARIANALAGNVVEFEQPNLGILPVGRLAHVRYVPHRNAAGKVVGLLVAIVDITQRKHAESALRAREAQLSLIFDNIGDIVFLIDVGNDNTFHFAAVSLSFLATTGLREDQVVGQPAENVLPQESQALIFGKYHEAIQNRSTVYWEEVSEFPSGIRAGEITLTPIFDADGHCTQLVGTIHDVSQIRRAMQKIQDSESRLEEAQRLGHLGSWSWDLHTDTLIWSDELCRIYGVDPASHVASFADFLDRVHPQDRAAVESLVSAAVQDRQAFRHETRIVRPDGEVRTISDQSEVVVDEHDRVVCMFGACLDITARKLAERIEAERRQILEQVAQNQPLPTILSAIVDNIETQIAGTRGSILLLREERLWLGASPNLPTDFMQALEGAAIGPAAGTCGTAAFRGETVITEDIASDPTWDGYRELALPHGLRACWSMPIPASDAGVLGTFAIYRDHPSRPDARDMECMRTACQLAAVAIEHRQQTDMLSHQAQHDALTGLPNRMLFLDRLRQAMAYAQRKQQLVAVLYLDLDRFKIINDTLGHTSGDELLREVAARLGGCLRKSDTLARMGGDEFTVVLTELSDPQDATHVASKLMESLRDPVQVGGREFVISVSVGISIYPNDGEDVEVLMTNADVAMYRAKDMGRNNFQWFTDEMNSRAMERLDLEDQLRHALPLHQLSLHYQPQCTQAGEIRGFEALMRWQHPTLGMVPPDRFIPLAEENGLIVPMGAWAMRTACAQVAAWRNAGHPDLRIAVNVSAVQFRRADWVDSVRQVLHETQLPPEALDIEITESLLLQNVGATAESLEELRQLGVGVAIDDFGTGYSSLSYLHKLPVTILKIDKSFVNGIVEGTADFPADAPIIRTIIALAENLRMGVIAEGVETQAQLDQLVSMGCYLLQGYFLHRPLTVEQVDALLGIETGKRLAALAEVESKKLAPAHTPKPARASREANPKTSSAATTAAPEQAPGRRASDKDTL